MRRLIAGLAVVLLSVPTAMGGGAPRTLAQGRFAGVQIAPAKFERDLDTNEFRIRVAVVNNDPIPHEVELTIARLGHDLDGTPLFIRPSYVQTHVTSSVEELSLASGERRDITIEGSIPDGDRSIYPAVVAQFPGAGDDPSVGVLARVAGFLLLRGPKPWDERVSVEEIGALPPARRGSRTVTLYAAVRNVGNVHVKPTGVVEITRDGNVIDRVRLSGDTIIPEFARRLTGRWTAPRGLTGTVELRAEISKPSATGTDTLQLGPDLATASIENLQATGEDGGRVSLFVVNTGTTTISPTVRFEATEDRVLRGSHEQVEESIEPGDAREVTWRAELGAGLYTTTISVSEGDRLLDESVVGFEVIAPGILKWIALALVVGVTVAHLARVRRRGSLF